MLQKSLLESCSGDKVVLVEEEPSSALARAKISLYNIASYYGSKSFTKFAFLRSRHFGVFNYTMRRLVIPEPQVGCVQEFLRIAFVNKLTTPIIRKFT